MVTTAIVIIIIIIIIIIVAIFFIYKLLTPLVNQGSKPTCPRE